MSQPALKKGKLSSKKNPKLGKGQKLGKGKPFPNFASDKEAEDFVDSADLSEYDFSKFRPFSEWLADLDSERKNKTITLRIPETLLSILKASAKKKNIPYQRLMRQLLAKGLFLPPQS
ncbi:MAG: CopG family antitoxin [Parvibaculales bacterium]